MMGRPSGQLSYQPIGDLLFYFPAEGDVQDYRRDLDLDTAVAIVSYTRGGIQFKRELFSSPADQVLVVRLTANKPVAPTSAPPSSYSTKIQREPEDDLSLSCRASVPITAALPARSSSIVACAFSLKAAG